MINVGIIGIGGMGRMHFNCYKNNPNARIVAICDIDKRKRDGDWSRIGINIDTSKTNLVDLSGIDTYADMHDLIARDDIELVDICLPTPLHSPASVAALNAGKHVVCEKPMARSLDACGKMIEAAQNSGRQLVIGHCLRYWPEYVATHELIASGKYGRPIYASFHRSSGTPLWGWNNWLATEQESGGAVLDMHIHDVDTALWWFGKPDHANASGAVVDGLSSFVESAWTYDSGLAVAIHGSWDLNDPPFRYAFRLVLESATILFDSADGLPLRLFRKDMPPETIEAPEAMSYQNEIDDVVDALCSGRKVTRVTPTDSKLAVEMCLNEIAVFNPSK